MTLVLAAQHPLWVAVVSDRLLSIGKVPAKSNAIKLVIYYCDMAFGYTGYASFIGDNGKPIPNDEWIAEALVKCNRRSSMEAVLGLQEQLDIAFPRMAALDPGFPGPHAIIGVGWDREIGGDLSSQRPLLVNISNMRGPKGISLATPAKRFHCIANSYDAIVDATDKALVRFSSVGWPPEPHEIDWMKNQLADLAESAFEPKQALLLMRDVIRRASKRLGGRMVGSEILATVLLRDSPRPNHIAFVNPQSDTGIVMYSEEPLPKMGERKLNGAYLVYSSGRDKGLYEAPHIVAPGFKIIGYFGQLKDGKAPPDDRYRFRFTKDEAGNLTTFLSPATLKTDRSLGRRRAQKRKRPKR